MGATPDFPHLIDLDQLAEEQRRLGALVPAPWQPGKGPLVVAAAFVAFARGEQGPGRAGDRAHIGAAATRDTTALATRVIRGWAPAPYAAGLLAAREGVLLQAALEALPVRPDLILVDATGRDHPRRAGLALHLGAVLDVPSIGVTHRPLRAQGDDPADVDGAWSPLLLDGEVVGRWWRPHRGRRPLALHAGWKTDDEVAVHVAGRVTSFARTPEPLRLARMAAREARSTAEARGSSW